MQTEFNVKKLKSGDCKLEVKGDLVIKHSIDFKNQLSGCVGGCKNLVISLEEITAIDVTAIQMIQSLRNEFNGSSKNLTVISPSNESILISLRNSGLLKVITNNV